MLRLGTPEDAVQWLKSRVRGQLRVDSRQIQPGDGFIAWPGAAHDGRQFVKAALAKGAEACLVEHDGIEAFDLADPAVAAYQDLKVATGPIAAGFYGQPSRALQFVAVTGTNGKTSTAWWLAQALSRLPAPWTCRSGVVGTLGTGFPPEVTHNGLTTPDPVLLHQTLRQFIEQGARGCAMEASSIGLAEHRLDGTDVDVAVLTNFTQDHLDYHHTMEAYAEAKAGLSALVLNKPATLRAGGWISAGMISVVQMPLPMRAAIAPSDCPQRCAPSPESLITSTLTSGYSRRNRASVGQRIALAACSLVLMRMVPLGLSRSSLKPATAESMFSKFGRSRCCRRSTRRRPHRNCATGWR